MKINILDKGMGSAMNKISVMIVDDEKLAVEDLLDIYDWEGNGFEIVATASNGKQALAKFTKLLPNLVITDIKMPFMDGLELTEEIRKINANTKILLLTAYSDFEYAKRAIKHGITDYLLKNEIDQQTLSDKLLALKDQVESESRTSTLLMQKVLLDLFNPGKEPDILYDASIDRLLNTPYYYFIIEEDMPLYVVNSVGGNEFRNYNEILAYCNRAGLSGVSIVCAATIRMNQILLILQCENNSSSYTVQSILASAAADMQKQLSFRFQCSFTVYVVGSRMNLKELKKIYFNAGNRFRKKYLLGNGMIHNLMDKSLDWTGKGMVLDEIRVATYMDKLNSTALQQYIDELYARILSGEADYNSLLAISQSLYLILKRYLDSLPAEPDSLDISFSENSKQWLNAKDIKDWMKESFVKLFSELQKILENKFSLEVVNAIKFIYGNFTSIDLKIDQIANHVGRGSAYLSVVFKKETGTTINEFITDLRMKRAKELLKQDSYKVYEVASMVGYGSSQYFSQIFYHFTGMTPNEYKKGGTK